MPDHGWDSPRPRAVNYFLMSYIMSHAVNYFPVFAKGPAIALALEHSGLDWEVQAMHGS